MDYHGYPDDAELQALQSWDIVDFRGLADFLIERWIYPNYISLNKKGDTLTVSTGGWSGHEELIDAINPLWYGCHFYSLKRGGHYKFKDGFKSCRKSLNVLTAEQK